MIPSFIKPGACAKYICECQVNGYHFELDMSRKTNTINTSDLLTFSSNNYKFGFIDLKLDLKKKSKIYFCVINNITQRCSKLASHMCGNFQPLQVYCFIFKERRTKTQLFVRYKMYFVIYVRFIEQCHWKNGLHNKTVYKPCIYYR